MEIDMKDANYDLRFLTTLEVCDHNIWVDPNDGTAIFINYSQDFYPIVQIFGIFHSENLVGFCIIPDNFNEASQNPSKYDSVWTVQFSVDRNTSESTNKIQMLKIFNRGKKSLDAFLGDGSDKQNIEFLALY